MKRDSTCNVSIATEHPLMSEEANLQCTYRPGRNGGTFGLPLGAKLLVADSTRSKKDWVTCQVASPAHRWRHEPSFPQEHVTSEIFTLTGTILKQGSAILILPYYPPQGRYLELKVKAKWAGHSAWQDVPFEPKTDTALPCVEVSLDKMGTFLLTFRPKTQPLHLSPQGGLFHPQLHRLISLRFPKKAVDCNVRYDLQILPVPEDCLRFCKDYFPLACHDLIGVSEFVDLHPSPQHCSFRRSATIKLPLPEGVEVVDDDSTNQIVVLNKVGEDWQWVDSKYKFARNSVTFDVKNPTKLCVVQSRPDRQRKMQEAASVLEERVGRTQGDLTLYLSLRPKAWLAVLECCPLTISPATLHTRQDQGFTAVLRTPPLPTPPHPPPPLDKTAVLNRRPPAPLRSVPGKEPEGVEMWDDVTWTVEVDGDVRATPGNEPDSKSGLQWFRHLPHSFRHLALQPATREERTLHGTVTLRPAGLEGSDPLREKLTVVFHLEVPEQAVKDYLFVAPAAQPAPPIAPPVAPPAASPATSAPPARRAAASGHKKPVFSFTETPMQRLTRLPHRYSLARSTAPSPSSQSPLSAQPNSLYWQYRRIGFVRPPINVDREPKVLSGKSLMTLSKVVDKAVPLAMELGLKESTVSGIGFDMLSSTRQLSDMVYKILLLWKRTCREKGDGAVGELVRALRELGKHSIADIVLDRHRRHQELTTDCFLQALVAGVNLYS